eukprot:101892-Prorocentrum_minimum.AAC.4
MQAGSPEPADLYLLDQPKGFLFSNRLFEGLLYFSTPHTSTPHTSTPHTAHRVRCCILYNRTEASLNRPVGIHRVCQAVWEASAKRLTVRIAAASRTYKSLVGVLREADLPDTSPRRIEQEDVILGMGIMGKRKPRPSSTDVERSTSGTN